MGKDKNMTEENQGGPDNVSSDSAPDKSLDVILNRIQSIEEKIAKTTDTGLLQKGLDDLKVSLTDLIKAEKVQNHQVRAELDSRIKVLQDEIRNIGGDLLASRKASKNQVTNNPSTNESQVKKSIPLTLLELD